jgi:uncharacterized protein YjbJ (UPF0337 family)
MKDKIKGKAEEFKGKMTGDRPKEVKGKARQGMGQVKEDARDLRREAEKRDRDRDLP